MCMCVWLCMGLNSQQCFSHMTLDELIVKLKPYEIFLEVIDEKYSLSEVSTKVEGISSLLEESKILTYRKDSDSEGIQ